MLLFVRVVDHALQVTSIVRLVESGTNTWGTGVALIIRGA